MQRLTAQQLVFVNDFMSNSLEFYSDAEAMDMLKEYGIAEITAKQILSFSTKFSTDPFFELEETDLAA